MKKIKLDGKEYSLQELSNLYGIKYSTLVSRLSKTGDLDLSLNSKFIHDSVREFFKTLNAPFDLIDKLTGDVYLDYVNFCVDNNYDKESKHIFTREIIYLCPELRAISSRRKLPSGAKSVRVFKLKRW